MQLRYVLVVDVPDYLVEQCDETIAAGVEHALDLVKCSVSVSADFWRVLTHWKGADGSPVCEEAREGEEVTADTSAVTCDSCARAAPFSGGEVS